MKSQKRHNPLPPSTFLRPDSIQVAQDMYSKFKIQNSKPTLGNKGFTLIEIAVVLVILGIVFMSVLKVESMVRNAKIRQVISQYRELQTAILIYRDKYGYLPGDDPYANKHVGSTHTGNGNGQIDPNDFEYPWVFEQLNKSGLIKGTPNNGALKHAFNDKVFVIYRLNSGIGNCVEFWVIPADVTQAIDYILDDGDPGTGSVRVITDDSDNKYLRIFF